MSCAIGSRHGSDPSLCDCGVGWQLQLRFDPLAWYPPYAMGRALKKKQKKTKQKKTKKKLRLQLMFNCLIILLQLHNSSAKNDLECP